MFKDESKKRIYGYRLCNDITINSPQKVCGILLKKEKYYEFQNRIEKLEPWIRSNENPYGILEIIMYDPKDLSREDIFSRRKVYSSDELFSMRLPELVDICETWDISYIRKSKDRIIEELLKQFKLEKESKELYTSVVWDEPEIVDLNNHDYFNSEIIDDVEFKHEQISDSFSVALPEENNNNYNDDSEIIDIDIEDEWNTEMEFDSILDDEEHIPVWSEGFENIKDKIERNEKIIDDDWNSEIDNKSKNKRFKVGL